jgi:uncharacterized protein (DUF58 family)
VITPHGVIVVFAGVAALVVGRVFGIVELFVIGSALIIAVVFSALYVLLRQPKVVTARWIHPAVLVAGDTGRVDIQLDHVGRLPSAACALVERVGRSAEDVQIARLPLAPMRPRTRTTTGYRLPSARRGVTELGPLTVELRDPLGLARRERTVAGYEQVVVAPRALPLDMPHLGQGSLGAALLDRARRLGPGDFHGLREYQVGDELRSIDWKASARTDDLMVKEHTVEGLHRCTVLLDVGPGAHPDEDAFERGVTAAASIVNAAARTGLVTRFVTAGGIDLRGPEVAMSTMRVLATIDDGPNGVEVLDRDPAEGLGMLVVVTGTRQAPGLRLAQRNVDPTTTLVAVLTGGARGRLSVDASSEDAFASGWQSLVGRGRIDLLDAPARVEAST